TGYLQTTVARANEVRVAALRVAREDLNRPDCGVDEPVPPDPEARVLAGLLDSIAPLVPRCRSDDLDCDVGWQRNHPLIATGPRMAGKEDRQVRLAPPAPGQRILRLRGGHSTAMLEEPVAEHDHKPRDGQLVCLAGHLFLHQDALDELPGDLIG